MQHVLETPAEPIMKKSKVKIRNKKKGGTQDERITDYFS